MKIRRFNENSLGLKFVETVQDSLTDLKDEFTEYKFKVVDSYYYVSIGIEIQQGYQISKGFNLKYLKNNVRNVLSRNIEMVDKLTLTIDEILETDFFESVDITKSTISSLDYDIRIRKSEFVISGMDPSKIFRFEHSQNEIVLDELKSFFQQLDIRVEDAHIMRDDEEDFYHLRVYGEGPITRSFTVIRDNMIKSPIVDEVHVDSDNAKYVDIYLNGEYNSDFEIVDVYEN
jgi:hypothetical protein